jgi:hypothetical protein
MARNEPDSPPDRKEIEFYSPRVFDVLSILFPLALTLFSVWAVIVGPASESPIEGLLGRIVFGAVAIFGGSVTYQWLRRWKDPHPRLAVTPEV